MNEAIELHVTTIYMSFRKSLNFRPSPDEAIFYLPVWIAIFVQLQKDINNLHMWSINNKMMFHPDKCKVVTINVNHLH